MTKNEAKELAAKEKRAIRKLAVTTCANHDWEYGCLLLEGSCYMSTIGFTNSILCSYFRDAVLPSDPVLEAIITGHAVKPCKRCGRKFPINGRQAYCSEDCAHAARKAATAERVRKHRKG